MAEEWEECRTKGCPKRLGRISGAQSWSIVAPSNRIVPRANFIDPSSVGLLFSLLSRARFLFLNCTAALIAANWQLSCGSYRDIRDLFRRFLSPCVPCFHVDHSVAGFFFRGKEERGKRAGEVNSIGRRNSFPFSRGIKAGQTSTVSHDAFSTDRRCFTRRER